MEKKMRLEVVNADSEDVYKALDDALFWGDVTKQELEAHLAISEELTEIDAIVRNGIERALNVTLPDSRKWYNGANEENA